MGFEDVILPSKYWQKCDSLMVPEVDQTGLETWESGKNVDKKNRLPGILLTNDNGSQFVTKQTHVLDFLKCATIHMTHSSDQNFQHLGVFRHSVSGHHKICSFGHHLSVFIS